MNEKLIIDINNFLQKLTENIVKPMYGVRDKNSVQLISETLNQEVFGVELYPTIFDKASYLWYSLSNYHCFFNGNKRTALVTTYIYLKLNGYCLRVDSSFYDISLNIVELNIEKERIKKIIEENTVECPTSSFESIQEQLETEFTENKFFEDVIINLSKT